MSDVTKQCRDKERLKPMAQRALELFLEECNRQKLNVLITETLRTKERQYYLACQGRTVSQAKAIGVPAAFTDKYCNPKVAQVTWTLDSNHLDGMAFDFCKNIKGEEYKDKTFFDKCGKIVADLGLEWGGAFGDSPHVQVPKTWKEPKPVDEEYKKAVTTLTQVLNINNAAWYPEPNKKNLVALVQKIGRYLYRINDYKFIITRLQQDGIITNTLLWQEHEYSDGNIKSLIKKVGKHIESIGKE